MITLTYPPKNTEIANWEYRLNNLPMKHRFEEVENLPEPQLNDGDEQVTGKAAIEQYLTNLEEFTAKWYEDRCDRYDYQANL